jgi:phosphinothricin acetyltransferase
MSIRKAAAADATAIAAIYNDGIDDRVATFETRHRTADEILAWLDSPHPIVLVTDDRDRIVAFASASAYRPRECYAGIVELSVYVARAERGRGFGRTAIDALCTAAEAAGYWKLLSRVFVENAASRRLLVSAGFREVGIYHRHGRLDGRWRDVVIVEKLLGAAKDIIRAE